MIYKYIYLNKKTGEKIFSHIELKGKDLKPLMVFRSVDIKPRDLRLK